MTERRRNGSDGVPDRHALAAAFRDNFIDVSYEWDLFFVDVLLQLRRASLDDMDVLLIVAVMGMEEKRRRQLAGYTTDASTVVEPTARAQMNASSLADVTGIPRETIRRKLRSMERAGLVDLHPGGRISFRETDASGLAVQTRYAEARDKVIDGASAFAALLVRKASGGA
jgi:DNA-binding transcriptional ArsR family regulator